MEWRKQQLQALEKMMIDNEGAIMEALEKDLGRSPFEAWLADIASTAGEAKDAAKNVKKWMRRKLPAAGDVAAARARVGWSTSPTARCWSSARGTSRSC